MRPLSSQNKGLTLHFFRVASYYFLYGFIKQLNLQKAEFSSLLLLSFFFCFVLVSFPITPSLQFHSSAGIFT